MSGVRDSGPRYDSKPRRWRHLDTMQFTTWIEADVPRMQCGTHGVKQVREPWAEPGSQFTACSSGNKDLIARSTGQAVRVGGAGRQID